MRLLCLLPFALAASALLLLAIWLAIGGLVPLLQWTLAAWSAISCRYRRDLGRLRSCASCCRCRRHRRRRPGCGSRHLAALLLLLLLGVCSRHGTRCCCSCCNRLLCCGRHAHSSGSSWLARQSLHAGLLRGCCVAVVQCRPLQRCHVDRLLLLLLHHLLLQRHLLLQGRLRPLRALLGHQPRHSLLCHCLLH